MGNNQSQTSNKLENLNVILIGKTGVGKSTLINSIFEEEQAEEGKSLNCTKEIKPYRKRGINLTLYDTPGLNLTPNCITNFKTTIMNIIKEQSKTKDINKAIHCIWYCVDSNSGKIEEIEQKIISSFQNIPVFIVLTKSINQNNINEMMRNIELTKMNVKYVVQILSKKMKNNEPFGINNLIYYTIYSIPSNIDYIGYKNKEEEYKKNIIITGRTGVGKSTLVNTILGEEKAKSGIYKSITQEIEEFDSERSPYHVFDTPGLELDLNKQIKLKKDILKLINDRIKTNEEKNYIHCIWYCVQSESKRIEEEEIKFINDILTEIKTNKIPVILVLTQCYDDNNTKEMIKFINSQQFNITQIVPIVAKEEYFEDLETPQLIKSFGIEELISFTNHFISNKPNSKQFLEHYGSDLTKEIQSLQKINVIVLGKEGSGKKTLMNSFLGENITENVNDTESNKEYENENSNFHFFHFPNIEQNLTEQIKLRENIIQLVRNKFETRKFQEIIHCLWFCIRSQPEEINESNMDFINILTNELKEYKIPVILVITQCYDEGIKDQMIQKIENHRIGIKYIQPILTENFRYGDESEKLIESFGINDLVDLTNSTLVNSFINECLEEQIANSLSDTTNKLNKINIITIGKAGVGKSTLINNFFRGHLAATGIGSPVTKRITPLTTPNSPLTIYDTPGLELKSTQQKELRNDIFNLIKNGYKSKDLNKFIHCIWYCINSESCRFEESEKEFIQELTKVTSMYQVPVYIILTQSYRKRIANEMKKAIESEKLQVIEVIPVVAQIKKIGKSICKPYGMEELAESMGNQLPEALNVSFNNVQIASLSYKRKCAAGAIAGFVAGSAAVGASPIPFSDCFLLAGLEVGMFSTITAIYKVEVSKGFISTVLSCLIGCCSASFIGRAIVTNIIKCIPFAGSIVGAVTGGITGGALTAVFGSTYMLIMEAVLKGEIDPKNISKSELRAFIKPAFNKKLEEEKKKEKEKKKEDEKK